MPLAQKYTLTVEHAILALEAQLAEFVAETDRSQLTGIAPDQAYELGYESAIFDLRKLHNPSPMEISLVSISTPPISDENKNSETSN